MGCDIHLFIEYRKPDTDHWQNLGSEFRLNRHYGMFSVLANVRNYWNAKPVAEQRGLPEDIGFRTQDGYTYFVCDNPGENERYVDKQRANQWVERGYSKWMGKHWVSNPDAHSISWLTPDEFETALNSEVDGEKHQHAHEYTAVLATMRSLEAHGFEARTVFWFDN